MVLGGLCLPSTQEGCTEGLSEGGWGVSSTQALHFTKTNFQPVFAVLGEKLAKGTECRPQSQCGKGCWATVRLYISVGSGGCHPDPFPNTKPHWRFKGGEWI